MRAELGGGHLRYRSPELAYRGTRGSNDDYLIHCCSPICTSTKAAELPGLQRPGLTLRQPETNHASNWRSVIFDDSQPQPDV
jgi:hypothetical protein